MRVYKMLQNKGLLGWAAAGAAFVGGMTYAAATSPIGVGVHFLWNAAVYGLGSLAVKFAADKVEDYLDKDYVAVSDYDSEYDSEDEYSQEVPFTTRTRRSAMIFSDPAADDFDDLDVAAYRQFKLDDEQAYQAERKKW